jgi:hypothetical protein
MSTVQDIEEAIQELPEKDLVALRAWFAEFDAGTWDRQFEQDAAGGRLDALADEALRDLHDGRCTNQEGRTVLVGSSRIALPGARR